MLPRPSSILLPGCILALLSLGACTEGGTKGGGGEGIAADGVALPAEEAEPRGTPAQEPDAEPSSKPRLGETGADAGETEGPAPDSASEGSDGESAGGGSDPETTGAGDGEAPGDGGATGPADGTESGGSQSDGEAGAPQDGQDPNGEGGDAPSADAEGPGGGEDGTEEDGATGGDIEEDIGPPPCAEDSSSCEGQTILKCIAGSWVPAIDCPPSQACHEGLCCVPTCAGKTCGDDGCGASCGSCEGGADCVGGACVGGCQPSCEEALCGDDGCGGACGTCPGGFACVQGACLCEPQCEGAVCGQDGCGSTCGPPCPEAELCSGGACVCAPQCQDLECGPDACGSTCGTCEPGGTCKEGLCLSPCAGGQTACKDDLVVVCDEDTYFFEPLIDCAVAKWVCEEGQCVEPGLPEPSCGLPCTGESVPAALCAMELCYPDLLLEATISSPTGDTIEGAWGALEHFGAPTNDLAPLAGSSYLALSTGLLEGDGKVLLPGSGQLDDPWSGGSEPIFDAVELQVVLKVPPAAGGLALDLLFMSQEYEEYVGSSFNDKLYVVLEGPATTGGQPRALAFGPCSDPDVYTDFLVDGEPTCWISINSAFSEPCTAPSTDLGGTVYECPAGSTTGWLRTTAPVVPYDQITLTVHIHDTFDQNFDSLVLIDHLQWLQGPVEITTTPL